MATLKKCKNCGNTYDKALQECPTCHEKNTKADKTAKNVSFLPVWKQIILFVIGFICLDIFAFAFAQLATLLIYSLRGKDATLQIINSPIFNLITQFAVYGFAVILMLILIRGDYKKTFFSYKKIGSYLMGLVAVLLIIGFELYYSAMLSALGHPLQTSGNQAEINRILNSSKIISVVVFVILGPLSEELTYRVGLYSLLRRKSKILGYIVTSLLFGLIHIISHLGNGNLVNELLNLPIYVVSGFVLTYIYEKHGLAASLTAHMVVNLISIL